MKNENRQVIPNLHTQLTTFLHRGVRLEASKRKWIHSGGYNVRIRVVFPGDGDCGDAVLASVALEATYVAPTYAMAATYLSYAPTTTNAASVVVEN